MVLPENVEELSLADMEKSSEEEEAKGRTFTDKRSFTNPNLRNTKENREGLAKTRKKKNKEKRTVSQHCCVWWHRCRSLWSITTLTWSTW